MTQNTINNKMMFYRDIVHQNINIMKFSFHNKLISQKKTYK